MEFNVEISEKDLRKISIPEEPPYTCPGLDRVIEGLKEIEKLTTIYLRLYADEECGNGYDRIDTILMNMIDIEAIRSENITLRAWGHCWKEYAEFLEGEN